MSLKYLPSVCCLDSRWKLHLPKKQTPRGQLKVIARESAEQHTFHGWEGHFTFFYIHNTDVLWQWAFFERNTQAANMYGLTGGPKLMTSNMEDKIGTKNHQNVADVWSRVVRLLFMQRLPPFFLFFFPPDWRLQLSSSHFWQKHMQLVPWLMLTAPPQERLWWLPLSVPRVLLGALHHQRHGQPVLLMPDGMLGDDATRSARPSALWRKTACKRDYRRRTFPEYEERRLDLRPLSTLHAADRKRTSWSKKRKRKRKPEAAFIFAAQSVTRHKKSVMYRLSHPYV